VRSLSPDEAELWSRVTATIRPLSREKNDTQQPEKKREHVASSRLPPPSNQRLLARALAPTPISHRTLDGSWDRRIRSGEIEPDRVLDLHGMNLERAWRAIDRGLEQAINGGERVVLLITGHHRPGDPPVERGRIRAAVHDWLAASRHSSRIASVRGAHRRHGGGGSLYIVLRRR
jgi:DNA-nicking Smr family endonuclease